MAKHVKVTVPTREGEGSQDVKVPGDSFMVLPDGSLVIRGKDRMNVRAFNRDRWDEASVEND